MAWGSFVATVSEHLGYLFAAERLLETSLRVPIFVSAIQILVRQFLIFRLFDLLSDEIAEDVRISLIFVGRFDHAFRWNESPVGLPFECAFGCPVQNSRQLGKKFFF